jgi:hypothetical protein
MRRLWILGLSLLTGCPSLGSGAPCAAADGGHPDGERPPIVPVCPGGCDEDAARSVVYDAAGRSMYAGQALIHESCAAGGNFCHSSSALDRFGVPAGLDFDIAPTASDGTRYDRTGSARLAYAHNMVDRQARAIWNTIANGSMPPGRVGDTLSVHTFGWITDPTDPTRDVPLPTLETDEGREIVRNWLACGAPIVEAWAAFTAPMCDENSDCPTGLCEADSCSYIGDSDTAVHRVDRPLEPNWRSIYLQAIQPNCTTPGCHAPDPLSGGALSAGLDLSTMERAYEALVDAEASEDEALGALCGGSGRVLVDPGNPDGSLLVSKLAEEAPECGEQMPFGQALDAEQVAVIREWIMAGAPPAPM